MSFPPKSSLWPHLKTFFGWTRASYALMSLFLAVILLIIIVWWPLVLDYAATYDPDYPFWVQFDWLLLGIFAVMSLLIMAGANFKRDAWIVIIGLCGGLVIESWGTQTQLWIYYTQERPPLWIIPAWPIASLSIWRLVKLLELVFRRQKSTRLFTILYWFIFPVFFILMTWFIRPSYEKSLTWMAWLTCILLILAPSDRRLAVLNFIAGSGLGYFLEVWGTTRQCWIYYTLQTPPLFAVLAHGLAAVAFWRTGVLFQAVSQKLRVRWCSSLISVNQPERSGSGEGAGPTGSVGSSRSASA